MRQFSYSSLVVAALLVLTNSCGDPPTEPAGLQDGPPGIRAAELDPTVDLSVTVSAPATHKAGNALSFLVTITNTSTGVTASGVRLTWSGWTGARSPSGANCTFSSCSPGPLSPGQSQNLVFTGTPNEAGTVSMTFSVTSSVAEADPANNTASASTEVTPGADLVILKTAPAQVVRGATFGYDLTVRNDGPGASAGVSLVDLMPELRRDMVVQSATPSAGSCTVTAVADPGGSILLIDRVHCTLGPMAAGASVTVRIEVQYAADPVRVGPLTNGASVAGVDGDINVQNNTATATTLFSPADLEASLTGPATALTGETITYIGTATNHGPDPATGELRISVPDDAADIVSATPSVGSCSISTPGTRTTAICRDWTLNAGESMTVTFVGIANRVGTLRVEAEARNPRFTEITNANDEAEVLTSVELNPDPSSADLAIELTAPATIRAGSSLSFLATVTNNSSDVIASGVHVTWTGSSELRPSIGADCFAGRCTIGALSPGQSRTLEFTGTPTAIGTIMLAVTVASATTDPDAANNTVSASTEVTSGPDLALTKTAPAQVVRGATFAYDLTVRNDGPGASAGVSLVDRMPEPRRDMLVQSATPSAGSCTVTEVSGSIIPLYDEVDCTLGPMAAGGSATVHIEVQYAADPVRIGPLTNSARVDGVDGDVNVQNNTATATTLFSPADLETNLTGPATALTGEAITYIGTATNHGPDPATGALRISIPDGPDIVSATPSVGSCSISTPGTRTTAICRGWTLNAGESVTVTFVAISATARTLVVIAEGRNDVPSTEVSNANDEARVTTAITSPVPVVSVSGNTSVEEGALETYNFSVSTASGSFTLVNAVCGDAGVVVDGSLQVTASGGSFQCRFEDGPATSTVSVSARDETHATTGSGDRQVTVANVPPTATLVLSATTVPEGTPFTIALNSPQDVATDAATLSFAFDCGSGYGSFGASVSATCPTADEGMLVARAKVLDKDGGVTEYARDVNVLNVAPAVGPVSAPVDPQRIGASLVATASYTDPGANDTHSALVDWGDGTQDEFAVSGGAISASHAYAQAGVFRVRMSVTDNAGALSNESVFEFVVAYDPEAGFVTGGGWIWSPGGACALWAGCTALDGKASFGFVAKYQKGVASGRTEFQFHAGDLKLRSETYEWLVVAGARAQFKGSATINGQGNYRFILTAIDGQSSGGDGVDRLRLKVWDAASGEIVYDNKRGSADDSADATALGGGSIMIHANR